MAGRGPAPKQTGRRTRHTPTRGEWKASPGIGWQHGAIPDPPDEVSAETSKVWQTWMRSWVAAHWSPMDLPGLHQTARLYDLSVEYYREPVIVDDDGKVTKRANPSTELRQWMDSYGLTKKGQQDRRWTQPVEEEKPKRGRKPKGPYDHLHVVTEAG